MLQAWRNCWSRRRRKTSSPQQSGLSQEERDTEEGPKMLSLAEGSPKVQALRATKRRSLSRELSRRKMIDRCTGCWDAAEGGRLLGRSDQRKLTREKRQAPTGSQSRGSREQRKKTPLTSDSGRDRRCEGDLLPPDVSPKGEDEAAREICCHQCLVGGMVGGRREESRSCRRRGSSYRNRD